MSSLRLVPVSGQPIEVDKEPSMVGRDPSCEIVVTDGSVSRRHARLERRGLAWWVVDQGSANGTYVNSQRIAEQALKTGQELRSGALAFRVEAAAAGLSTEYKARLDDTQFQAIATVIQQSKDATFPSRSVDNDRATLKGVLTGGAPQPITIVLVKEGGAWKVDDVRLGVE